MKNSLANSWHFITGLAGMGAVSALAATGTISGAEALPIISAIVGVGLGGGLAGSASGKAPTA